MSGAICDDVASGEGVEELDGFAGFPAVVGPEPIVGRLLDDVFDGVVEGCGGAFDVLFVDGYFWGEGDFPVSDAGCFHGDGEDGGVGAFCEDGDEWGG